ncbi:uncharacterized protein fgl2b [Clarias gariepinus]|uniref:uncharacterized protein fgl2b n=1 Tax=Clarias gariepinus TaxID=13013 RepID=UPI00234DDF5A|nr:uncharacterized protein fgl2b [Clarias gariepinus]
MWLSMFSVWGSLLTLVASQSCPDPSENSASWVRLKPLGQCKDGESTCPYRITLPPLTVQLPKHFRELEKMAEELQSLTEMLNQLKADCCECKDRQEKDWNIRTDNEGEDEEKIQASKGTLKIKERQQDIVARESTVQVTTSRSGMEDILIISSDAKDINPTANGKQRNTNQERKMNPQTTKPRPESNVGQKGFNPVRKNLISGSMSKAEEVPSLTTTKKNTPQAKLTESSFSGHSDNEPPKHHEKPKDNPIKVGHGMNPSETLTAKGKVKSVPEYHVVTLDTEDDVETKQLQTTKGDKVQEERRLVPGNDAQNNRELEISMKQLTGKTQTKEDNKELPDAGMKESRSNISDDSVSVIQQPTLKNMEKNNHGATSTKPKPLKPGIYSGGDAKVNSKPVNTDDTTRRQKKVMSPITGRANVSHNISQMDQQTVGIESKNAFIPDMDATMDTGTESKVITAKKVSEQAKSLSPANNTVSELKHSRPPNTGRANSTADGDLINRSTLSSNVQTRKKPGKDAESNTGMNAHRVSGLQNSGLPISGKNDGKADVSPTNSQIPNIKYDFKAGTDSEIDAGIDLKPVNIIETVSEIKNSRSPILESVNVTADVDLINAKRKSSNSQTTLKPSKDAESRFGMNSNLVSVQNNSRSPVSGTIDGMVGESLTNPQVGHRKTHGKTNTESGSEARVGKSNPVNNVETVSGKGTSRSPISKERLKNSRPPNSGRANSTADADLIIRSTPTSNVQTPKKPGKDAESNTGKDAQKVRGLQNLGLPIPGINDGKVDVSPTNLKIPSINYPLKTGTDSEIDAGIDLKPVNIIETVSEIKNLKSPISDSTNVTGDVDIISAKRKSSNSHTTLKSSKDAESHISMNSNPVNVLNNSRSPVLGKIDALDGETNPQVVHRKTHGKVSTESGSDARVGKSNPINNVEIVSGQGTSPISKEGLKNSRSSILDRANSTAEIDLEHTKSLNPQMPFTHDADVHSKSGIDQHQFNASETVSHLQTSKSPKSDITDTVAVGQTYPGTLDDTFTNPFEPVTDKDRNAEMDLNPLSKVKTNNPLEMPQLSVTDKADATVNVNQINPQTTYSNSKNTTVILTSDNKVETVSGLEKTRLPIAVSERKPGKYPNRNQTTDIESKETSKPPISDSRPEVSGTNSTLNGNSGLPRRQFLPRSKVNMTQPRNGWVKSAKPMSTDTKRKIAPTNNKTTSLRSDAMTSGRRLPTGLLPKRQEKQQEITHQPERISPTGISLSKDYIQRKPNILQRLPVNQSKAFGSEGSKNTSRVIDYTISSGTTHSNSKTASGPNKFNSTAYDMSRSVSPTLATQDNVDRADTKETKTLPTVNVLRTLINHHVESTSQSIGNKPKGKNTSVSSREDLVLDTAGKTGRDTQPRVVEETKGTERRPGQTSFKTSSKDSNQQKLNKPPRAGSIQNLNEKMPLVVESSRRHELNYPTTVATPFTVKPQIKDNYSKGSRFTPPIKTAPHFVDQDPVEQAKTTSGVKVSNKHIHPRLENPSQEMEPKSSHSDTGNKEFHSASSGQGSRVGLVTDLQPNSLDPIQNRTTNSKPIVMDIVKASTGSKVSTISTESTNKNKAKDLNPVAINRIEANTEANQVTQSLDNAKHHGKNKSLLGSTDPVEDNKEGHSINNNNGNHYPVSVTNRTGATLNKIAAGHPNNGGNKKPLTVNNMDDRQGLEKQLLNNCRGQCDHRPASQSILNSHETSNNDRDKPSQDCSDFMRRNLRSGIYNITPAQSGNRTFPVFCNMKSSGGGWTLIQRRFDGSISFNRTWNDYKQGFGKLMGEFWLGNDKIHWLTSTKTMVLRIELEDLDGNKEYAQYDHFHVANESQYYKLTIEGYSGTAGDAMQYSKHFNHNQKNFTTPDRDNDQYTSGNCGAYYGSGWWFDACLSANLNGKYYETKYRGVRNGIFWGTWHNISIESYLTHDRQSFKTVRMMIRPRTGFLMD